MRENKVSDYEKKLNAEIEQRLNAMESQNYIFPARLNKRDYLIVYIVVLICLAFLIIGAFL